MARLIVGSITVRGFMSYGDTAQTLQLGGRGPVAVVGPNGVGKSSIVSRALTWALYGKCSPERMGSNTQSLDKDDLVNERCTEASVTLVLLDVDDGLRWAITRTRRRGSADQVAIVRSGPDGDSAQDGSQGSIDALIGAPHGIFVRTVVRGQNDPWFFAERPDGGKREVLDGLTGADQLNRYEESWRALRKARDTDLRTFTTRGTDARRRCGGFDVDTLRLQAEGWDTNRDTDLQAAREELVVLEAQLEAGRTAALEASFLGDLRQDIEARRPVLDLTPWATEYEAARVPLAEVEAGLSVAQDRFQQVEQLAPGATCPTCQQKIGPMAPVAAIRNRLWGELGEATRQAEYTRECCDAALQRWRGAEAWLTEELTRWQGELDAAAPAVSIDVAALERSVELAARNVAQIEATVNPYAGALEQAAVNRAGLEREAAQFEEAARQAQVELSVAQTWEEIVSPRAFRAHLADDKLEDIERHANRWLSILSRDTMAIEFPLGKKRDILTKVSIRTPAGVVERSLLAYSGGQRARINLAVDLAIGVAFSRDGALALSCLVLDEAVFSGLDEDGKESVIEALTAAGVADIIVIDHDSRLVGQLPRTIEVSLDENGFGVLKESAALRVAA